MIKFGTDGFRAIMSEDFTKQNVQKIAQSLSKIIKKDKSTKPVVVGYDKRFMSEMYAKWIVEVLAGNGINCLLYTKPVPTPTVMFSVKNLDLDYGITITASHNPYMYNGVKVCTKGGIAANVDFTSKLEKLANSNLKIKSIDLETAKINDLVKDIDNLKDYLKNISKFISKEIKNNNLKILFNAMNGVTAESAKIIAKSYNIKKFDIVRENTDPYFEFKLPCPNENSLENFKKDVVKGKYSIGLACDGDGDRLGVVDELGNYHDNNTILAVVYYYLVKYRNMKGDIVKTYPTSNILNQLANIFGYKCHEIPVGFKHVASKMQETDALLGGESSGGMTMRSYTPCKDSMFSIALLLDAMVVINKPLSKIVKEVQEFSGYISTYIEKSAKVKDRNTLIKALTKKTPNFSYKPMYVYKEDGFRYVFEDDSWVIIRFSGTENLLRYYMEFQTEIECERNTKAVLDFIKSCEK